MPILRASTVVKAVAIAAVLFGVVTMIAGARVLLGADPGYVVYLPLLGFNAVMGVAYAAVGVIAWRRPRFGVYGAAAIFLANLLALAAIGYLYTPNGAIAATSVQAMTLRTVVWLVFLLALAWSSRRIDTEK